MRCDLKSKCFYKMLLQCFSKKGLKTVTFAVQAPHVRGSSPYSAVVREAFFKLFFVVHRGTCRGVTVPRAASVVRGHPPLCRVGKCPRRAAARTADRKFQLSAGVARTAAWKILKHFSRRGADITSFDKFVRGGHGGADFLFWNSHGIFF